MRRPSCRPVSGPLAPFAVGFWEELARQGYSGWTAEGHLQLMADLSRWMDARGLVADQICAERVELFLADRRARGRKRRLSPRGLAPLLAYLRGLGVAPPPSTSTAGGLLEELLEEFVAYLRGERGLAESTVRRYHDLARLFLSSRQDGVEQISCLSADELGEFMLARWGQHSAATFNWVAAELRSLLRFLYVRGYTATSLAAAVPTGPSRRGGSISRAAAPGVAARMLASCDRRTGIGRRDFAILTVLWRLGLRAGEVAALTVDDIDWRAGELVVTGKGGRQDRLPLPTDVGQAIADYCRRGRPRSGNRSLFLQAQAPYRGLARTTVGSVAASACDRAGLPRIRPHALRHAAACGMRAAGAPLLEIGQVLRHRDAATTAVYAKDDCDALAVLARPWPGAP
jgi:integrase/recombinase XerD